MSETFSEADLEPTDEERRAGRRQQADRAAACVAAVAAGVVPGGLVALGACAAPFVFRLTPAPWSGHAMGAAFSRWDRVALGCAAVVLLAEIVRTYLARRKARRPAARVRRMAGVLLAGAIAYQGMVVTPAIVDLHAGGAERGVGDAGQRLEAIHDRASVVGRVQAALAVLVVVLHVLTLSRPRPEDEDDDEAAAPLPPGPRG
jgi:hypothetical protein